MISLYGLYDSRKESLVVHECEVHAEHNTVSKVWTSSDFFLDRFLACDLQGRLTVSLADDIQFLYDSLFVLVIDQAYLVDILLEFKIALRLEIGI